MKEVNDKPTLEEVEFELKATIGGLAVLLNECLFPNSGYKLLGLDSEPEHDLIDYIQVQKTSIGRDLPVYYAYAYEGKLTPGYELELNGSDGNMELLSDFFEIFKPDRSYFDLCAEASALTTYEPQKFGLIRDMLNRVHARSSLDNGDVLSITDIALLAEMNERSVKNALNADKDRLEVNAKGHVENNVAKAWLNGRRGYVPTKFKDYPKELDVYPDDLTTVEIPSFIANRLIKIYANSEIDEIKIKQLLTPDSVGSTSYDNLLLKAAEIGKLSVQDIKESLLQPFNIKPELITNLAKCIQVDTVWFNHQVMRALFPSQVDMLLNPNYFNSNLESELSEKGISLEVIISENMIKHGYIDIPSHSKGIFPESCFGTRSDETENQIKIIYGNTEALTDIRIKSEKTISFRKRFGSWFRDYQVTAGDRISITKVGDSTTDVYELVHIPK